MECKHNFVFLESDKLEKTEVWIFYCSKCLKIKMVTKQIPVSDIQ